MLLDTGTVEVCNLVNQSEPGTMPVYKLSPVTTQYYGEKTIGITRSYLAKGVNEQVDMLIEIWDEGIRPRIGMYAVLIEENEQYQINNVQHLANEDGLKVYDLTLSRVEDFYDVDR